MGPTSETGPPRVFPGWLTNAGCYNLRCHSQPCFYPASDGGAISPRAARLENGSRPVGNMYVYTWNFHVSTCMVLPPMQLILLFLSQWPFARNCSIQDSRKWWTSFGPRLVYKGFPVCVFMMFNRDEILTDTLVDSSKGGPSTYDARYMLR